MSSVLGDGTDLKNAFVSHDSLVRRDAAVDPRLVIIQTGSIVSTSKGENGLTS